MLFFGLGGTFYFQTQKLVNDGATASGTVVRYESRYPVIRFTPEGGSEVERRSSFGSNPHEYTVGQTVQVFYDKTDPTHWSINSWMSLYFLPMMFCIAGGGLTLASLIVLAYSVKKKRATGPIQ